MSPSALPCFLRMRLPQIRATCGHVLSPWIATRGLSMQPPPFLQGYMGTEGPWGNGETWRMGPCGGCRPGALVGGLFPTGQAGALVCAEEMLSQTATELKRWSRTSGTHLPPRARALGTTSWRELHVYRIPGAWTQLHRKLFPSGLRLPRALRGHPWGQALLLRRRVLGVWAQG